MNLVNNVLAAGIKLIYLNYKGTTLNIKKKLVQRMNQYITRIQYGKPEFFQ